MTHIEAMKQALDALETYHGYMEPLTTVFGGPRVPAEQSTTGKVEKAITSLRQAIAEAKKQEPVAWPMEQQPDGSITPVDPADMTTKQLQFYTTPQQRKPMTNENPLLVFAKECVLGAYSETELADAAFRAIEAAHNIQPDTGVEE